MNGWRKEPIQLINTSLGLYPIPFRVIQPVNHFLTGRPELSTSHLAPQVEEVISVLPCGTQLMVSKFWEVVTAICLFDRAM
jgi:hypothetical protein